MDFSQKKTAIRVFTEGKLTPQLIKFAIPVLLSHLMMVLLNTVDMVVVGYRMGEAGTSAVSIGGSVAMFLNAFIGGFAAAVQVIIAMKIGSCKREGISRLVTTVCSFVFLAAIASMLIMLPLTDTMLKLLSTPKESYSGAFEYSRICLFGIIPIYFYHIISAIFRGMGDSKNPLLFITTACGLNILLDVILVLGFDMGVGGAALATVLAQLVSVILSFSLLIKRRKLYELKFGASDFLKWDERELGGFLRLAIPMALNNSAIQIANMVITSLINDYGVTVSAFSGIRANIATTVDLILGSLATAGAMIIGQNIAAGKLKRVNGTLFRVFLISACASSILILAFLLFPIGIFRIFTDEEGVLQMVKPYLPILIFSLVNASVRPTVRALFDGSGNKKINVIVALLDALLSRIGLALLFCYVFNLGYMGLWLGVTVAELVPIFIGVIFYFASVRRRIGHKKA